MTDVAEIGRVVHEVHRVVQMNQNNPTIAVSPPWDDFDQESRALVISRVKGVQAGVSPEQSHEDWCVFKLTHGWTLGPVKDGDLKQHPSLVPYAELPPDRQMKDRLFAAIVKVLSTP